MSALLRGAFGIVCVALLGMRITVAQVESLGLIPVLTVILAVATTIAFGAILSRRLGLSSKFGILSGGSVAICGASAALAIATAVGRAGRAALEGATTKRPAPTPSMEAITRSPRAALMCR